MSERDVIARTPHPATVASLTRDLRALGVTDGMTVLVHSSLSSIGWVAGGPFAVVLALEAAVGESGTLVMPTHSGEWSDPERWENPPVPASWWQTLRDEWPAFDTSVPTRGMGAIVECFRMRPGVIRSSHPQVSFAARGPKAHQIVRDHSLEHALGEGSPLARIYDVDGHVLLLGVGYDACTSIHLAEYRATWPGKQETELSTTIAVDGERRRVTFPDLDGDTDDFEALGEAFERDHPPSRGTVGLASCRLFSQRELVDLAVGWLSEHRMS